MSGDRCGIYAITCQRSNGTYVGKTSRSFEQRWQEHKNELQSRCHDNYKLQQWADAYGVRSLQFEVVEICDYEDLSQRELYWIAKEGTLNIDPSQVDAQRRLTGRSPQKQQKQAKGRSVRPKTQRWPWWLELPWLILWGVIGWCVWGAIGFSVGVMSAKLASRQGWL